MSVETRRLATATAGAVTKMRPASIPTRASKSLRPTSISTTEVSAWITGSGARIQNIPSLPIEVESLRIQPISGGLE